MPPPETTRHLSGSFPQFCAKTLWIESLIHGHFVTAFTATLSQKATATLSHKPIVSIPIDSPVVGRALLWKTFRFPQSHGPDYYQEKSSYEKERQKQNHGH
jgi:hypothetical protein